MQNAEPKELSTKRLRLRPFAASDRAAVLDTYSDEETLRYWSREPIASLAEADELIEKERGWAASGNCFNWALALADTDLLIGKISLFQIDQQNRRGEIGYLLNRDYWGKGYMSEAMARVLAFAFDELDMHRIEADTDPDNRPSLTLLERFGFVREGFFRERWRVHGQWLDSIMLGLLRSDLKKVPPPK